MSGQPEPSVIGQIGEFTAADGITYQCVVTGTDEPPWDNDSLVITYVRNGLKIQGAMIPRDIFKLDRAPV
jgi:hypothetical protein